MATTSPQSSKAPHSVSINGILLGVSLLVLIGVLWMAWQALEGQVSVASDTPVAQAKSWPDLKLNNQHHRQGQEIEVNPADLGKSNPFTK